MGFYTATVLLPLFICWVNSQNQNGTTMMSILNSTTASNETTISVNTTANNTQFNSTTSTIATPGQTQSVVITSATTPTTPSPSTTASGTGSANTNPGFIMCPGLSRNAIPCSCDITGRKCNVNCYCDPDCSAADLMTFTQCDGVSPISPDTIRCVSKSVFFRENHPFQSYEDGDQICIIGKCEEKCVLFTMPSVLEKLGSDPSHGDLPLHVSVGSSHPSSKQKQASLWGGALGLILSRLWCSMLIGDWWQNKGFNQRLHHTAKNPCEKNYSLWIHGHLERSVLWITRTVHTHSESSA